MISEGDAAFRCRFLLSGCLFTEPEGTVDCSSDGGGGYLTVCISDTATALDAYRKHSTANYVVWLLHKSGNQFFDNVRFGGSGSMSHDKEEEPVT